MSKIYAIPQAVVEIVSNDTLKVAAITSSMVLVNLVTIARIYTRYWVRQKSSFYVRKYASFRDEFFTWMIN